MKMPFRVSDNFRLMTESASDEQKKFIFQSTMRHRKQYEELLTKYNAESVAFRYYEHIDEIIAEDMAKPEKFLNVKSIACKKGCNFCCYQDVCISREEAILLLKHSKEIKLKLPWKRIKDRAGGKKLPYEETACPFLVDGACSVYEYRPITCRKAFVLDTNEQCDLSKGDATVQRLSFAYAEITATAIMNATDTGSMEKMLLKYKKEASK